MLRQEMLSWPTPVLSAKKRGISFETLQRYCHLKPATPEEIVITDLSEIINREHPACVTKHAKADHVRLFREEGSLKLGTFREYRESDDPANQDPTEGQLSVWIEQSDYTYHDVGCASDRFKLFCTSAIHAKTNETSGYGDSRFVIDDLSGFLNAVAQEAGIIALAMSRCLYRNSRVLQVEDANTTGSPNPLNGPSLIQSYAQIGLSFIKPRNHHEHSEFRFLWYDKEGRVPVDGIIRCPEARNYCSFP